MSKDRYSDDHTIEIVGDTNTLTIDGNLVVTGSVSADVNATNITSGSITVDEINSTDLVITANSIEVNSTDITFSSTPERETTEPRYASYHASAFTWADPDNFVGTGPLLTSNSMFWRISENSAYTRFACPINNIPNGAIITGLKMYYTPGHIDDELGASLWAVSLDDGSNTEVGSESLPISPNVYSAESVTLTSLPQIDYQNNIYFISFSGKNGSSGTYSSLYGARILYQTKSIGL